MGRLGYSAPLLIGTVIFGAGLIWFMRSKEPKVYTQPILTVVPGYSADISRVANLTQGFQAAARIAELQHSTDY